MLKRSFAAIMILILSSLLVLAEDGFDDQGDVNDPTDNDRANACYEGGSMDGKCDEEVEWQAGWYLIRYEFGMLTREEVPGWVVWVLPPEIVPEELAAAAPAGVVQAPGCWNSGEDFSYSGTPNTPGNLSWYGSFDGSCSSSEHPHGDYVVVAASQAEADAICGNPTSHLAENMYSCY